jgi:hypothetical protein
MTPAESAAAAIELRQIWPGCSFEIVFHVNAGFYAAPTHHVEIGVISTQYEVHERWRGATLSEAMQQVRARGGTPGAKA